MWVAGTLKAALGEPQEVGRKGNKAMGKKIYNVSFFHLMEKKLTLAKETKQNYN